MPHRDLYIALHANRIIWHEALAFLLIAIISWVSEINNALHGKANWAEARFETLVVLIIAVPTMYITWRIVRRLHYVEGFLRVCAWCKRVGYEGEWHFIEEFMEDKLFINTSHGICGSCQSRFKGEKNHEDHQHS